jgi:hypothetical protein
MDSAAAMTDHTKEGLLTNTNAGFVGVILGG